MSFNCFQLTNRYCNKINTIHITCFFLTLFLVKGMILVALQGGYLNTAKFQQKQDLFHPITSTFRFSQLPQVHPETMYIHLIQAGQFSLLASLLHPKEWAFITDHI